VIRFIREGFNAAATRQEPEVRSEFSTADWGVYEYTSRGTINPDPRGHLRRTPTIGVVRDAADCQRDSNVSVVDGGNNLIGVASPGPGHDCGFSAPTTRVAQADWSSRRARARRVGVPRVLRRTRRGCL
jgi:hypothetical protein